MDRTWDGRVDQSRRGSRMSGIPVMVLAMFLIASCSNPGGEPDGRSPTGVADPTADVRILDDCPQLPCDGPLEPGRYRWTFSDPTIDFEIRSSGWTWLYGGGGLHLIADETPPPRHEGLYLPDGIYFLHDPTIASQDCEEASEPGVGRSLRDLVGWLESAPGLAVSEPTPVTIGGLEGMQLDIELDRKWRRTCPFSEDLPAVPLLYNGAAPLGGYQWTILRDQSLRWFILDSADGIIIVNVENDPGGLPRDELLRAAGEIVDSLAISA